MLGPRVTKLPSRDGNRGPFRALEGLYNHPVKIGLRPVSTSTSVVRREYRVRIKEATARAALRGVGRSKLSFIYLAKGPKANIAGRTVVRDINETGHGFSKLVFTKGVRDTNISRPMVGLSFMGELVRTNTSIVLVPSVKAIPKVALRVTRSTIRLYRLRSILTVDTVNADRRNSKVRAVE